MTGLKRALIGLAALAAFLGVTGSLVVLTSDHASPRGLMSAAILTLGWSFAGTGLYLWQRRPESRIGPMMVATGFLWLVQSLSASDNGWVFTIAFALGPLVWGLLVHLLVSFPEGLERDRLATLLIAGTYFDTAVPQLVQLPFTDYGRIEGCEGCPANPLLVSHEESVVDITTAFTGLFAMVLLAGLVIALRRRWRRANQNQRRALAGVFWTGGLAIGFQIAVFAIYFAGGSQDLQQGAFYVGAIAFAAVPFAFMAGQLRTRLGRGEAVSALVSRLGRGEQVRDAIADALGDQTIELAYWLPSRDTYVDAEGVPVELHECCTPVEHDGRPVAAILHDRGLTEEHDLIRSVGAAAALALENERLDAELRARLVELKASRARIVQATDDERRRLERDLHDGAQQRLVALALNLKLARAKLESDPAVSAELLDEAITNLAHATEELRDFARGIHPAVLSDRGLGAALTVLADRAPLPVEIAKAPEERLPDPVESAAYYVVAEALTNVAKYAGATHAEVRVERTNGRLDVEVADDGVGGADSSKGSGLRGLADRVGALDGRLEIDSPPGGGTRVRARIPCE